MTLAGSLQNRHYNTVTMQNSTDHHELNPPLKWAGGKRWLVPYLELAWSTNQHRRLVEPFCGGLAIALGLQPHQALLNDINPHLINFYRWLKAGFKPTLNLSNKDNNKETYSLYRTRFNELIQTKDGLESSEAAELFYYLNRTCFNGLCRFSKKGKFNVPFGKYNTINYTSDFSEYKHAFKNWDFTVNDFEALSVYPDDLIYADPPYDVDFVNYSKEGFNWNDQVRLAKWLAQHKGPVIASNQATDRIIDLYSKLGFEIVKIHLAPRKISSNGDRRNVKEVIMLKDIPRGMIPKMKPQKARTSDVHKSMVLQALEMNGYRYIENHRVGERPMGGEYIADIVACNALGETVFISLQWQQASGTTEQKVPFEVICMTDVVRSNPGQYKHAYLVLGGEGWTKRHYYVSNKFEEALPHKQYVTVLTFENFVARANKHDL